MLYVQLTWEGTIRCNRARKGILTSPDAINLPSGEKESAEIVPVLPSRAPASLSTLPSQSYNRTLRSFVIVSIIRDYDK